MQQPVTAQREKKLVLQSELRMINISENYHGTENGASSKTMKCRATHAAALLEMERNNTTMFPTGRQVGRFRKKSHTREAENAGKWIHSPEEHQFQPS